MKGPRRRQRESFLPWVLLVMDIVVAYSVLHAAFWFRFQSGWVAAKLSPRDYPVYYNVFHLVVLLAVFGLQQQGLYRSSKTITFGAEALKVLKVFFLVAGLLAATSFFIRPFSFSRTFLLMAGLSLVISILIARYIASLLIMKIDKSRGSFRNILVIGSDANVEKIIEFYRKNERLATKVHGLLDSSRPKGSLVAGVAVRGTVEDLPELLKKEYQVHEVLVADPGLSEDQTLKVLYECEKEMVDFRRVADLFGLISSKMRTSYLGGVPVLSFSESPLLEWENRVLKRAMDLALSAAGLAVLWPVFLLLALCVKVSSPGPVLFKQKRVGQDGRQFSLYKFRTMRVGAEESTGPVWAKENDERRTRLGAFLREKNLDELPQLFNVLRGDMSLVGPRPERPFFTNQFKEDIPRYMARHSIRSGMSGWAQVNGLRGNTSIEERTKYDLYYLENWSLFLDIKILFLTFFARRNAY